ncbi:(Fe-S)-binding protein [Candidatus Woesearchaeota archaeon]|nr:(Fe-S)-binding protein [Candidatus Woesearchaeota archaeon]
MPKGFLSKIRNGIKDLKPGRILYYPGCMTKYGLVDVFNNYKSLLTDIGIDYIMINELKCCGSPLLNAGYKDDFEEIRDKNIKAMKKHSITKIITNCPHCYEVFKKHYDFNGVKVEHTTQTLEANKRKLIAENPEEASYHDPCLLARKNMIIKEPRAVLAQTGFKLEEPFRARKRTFCCGAGGGVKQNSPKIANKIARQRLRQLKTRKIIVACPYCYVHLRENVDIKSKKKIVEISKTLTED